MKREKQLSVIVIILLLLSLFSTTPMSITFDNPKNIGEQVLEDNNAEETEVEKDDKFFEEFFCKLSFKKATSRVFATQIITYSHLETSTPFRPPIFS